MKSNKISTVLLIMILVIGLCLLLYPTFSNYWNSFTSTRAIGSYQQEVLQIDNDRYQEIWEAAQQYNLDLNDRPNSLLLPESMRARYNENLNISGTGVMAYIKIPCIDVNLPIYHGTDETVLQIAVGHLEWTHLPVGGAGTHSVFSGHRGLPSAKLFTDLDEVQIGDTFELKVLDETLTYRVDQIKIVEPHEIGDLRPVDGLDLCTLVTCTPYGINSHRLLIRGQRTDNAPVVVERRVTADAVQVEPLLVACVLVVPMVLLGIALVLIFDAAVKRKHKHF